MIIHDHNATANICNLLFLGMFVGTKLTKSVQQRRAKQSGGYSKLITHINTHLILVERCARNELVDE